MNRARRKTTTTMTDPTWLLAIDIGNTQVVIGVLEGEELHAHYRLTSRLARTSDELLPMLEPLLRPYVDHPVSYTHLRAHET